MSVFTKVLLFLNLFVALFLLFLTGSIVGHRNNWTKRIDDLKRTRDGIELESLLASLQQKNPERWRQVTNELKSRAAQRVEAARGLSNEPVLPKGATGVARPDPLSEEARKFINEIGPEEYKRLVQRRITADNPKLIIEERELAARKATLGGLRDDYQYEVNDLSAAIARLNERLKEETDYEKRVQAENADRRREIAQLYMEFEEAQAGRKLAESQEADMRYYLDLTRKRIKQLIAENRGLAEQIRGAESQEGGRQ